MDLSVILAAAGSAAEPEKSELPFFLAGGLLASFAVVMSVVGFKKPDFPATQTAARGVMALGATLVAATMFAIVYVST
jgi:hypothetical protein